MASPPTPSPRIFSDSPLLPFPQTLSPHVCGVGIDVMRVERLKSSSQLSRFLERVYAREEQNAFQKPDGTWNLELLASAFALKEATLKALGTGWGQGIELHQVVTHWQPDSTASRTHQWTVRLVGKALEHATSLCVQHLDAQCHVVGGHCLATVWLWGATFRAE